MGNRRVRRNGAPLSPNLGSDRHGRSTDRYKPGWPPEYDCHVYGMRCVLTTKDCRKYHGSPPEFARSA